jgi:hypothetical protein
MGQLELKQAQSVVCSPKGLPLENTPPDCPDTSLQYHSRHWITSFQNVADKGEVDTDFVFGKPFYTALGVMR